jgi:hypothetical protein
LEAIKNITKENARLKRKTVFFESIIYYLIGRVRYARRERRGAEKDPQGAGKIPLKKGKSYSKRMSSR